jgi:cytochrome oxidase Cu insertion factor (SCO1/SenC/PrrC family)
MMGSARRPPVADAADASLRLPPGAQRLVFAVVGVVLAGVIALAIWQALARRARDAAPPVYGVVPAFSLTERRDAPVASEALRGKVWVASFIFTRCGGICPGITARLGAFLRQRPGAAPPVTAVSFSVDPAHDRPPVLAEYATRFGADPLPWLFLTGDQETIAHVVRDGFHLALTETPAGAPQAKDEPITHSDRLVLVDAAMQIRGYYRAGDPEAVAQLERDLAAVSAETASSPPQG